MTGAAERRERGADPLDRAQGWLDRAVFALAALLTLAIVTLVVVAVVMRYFLGAPLIYSYDLSTLIFAWIVFLGASLAERDGTHLAVDILDQSLPPPWARGLRLARLALLVALSLFFAWIGLRLFQRAGMTLPALGISVRWLYGALPLGFALLALAQLASLARIWREC